METVQRVSVAFVRAQRELQSVVNPAKDQPLNIFEWHAAFQRLATIWPNLDPQERHLIRAVVRYFDSTEQSFNNLPRWPGLISPTYLWLGFRFKIEHVAMRRVRQLIAAEDNKAQEGWDLAVRHDASLTKAVLKIRKTSMTQTLSPSTYRGYRVARSIRSRLRRRRSSREMRASVQYPQQL